MRNEQKEKINFQNKLLIALQKTTKICSISSSKIIKTNYKRQYFCFDTETNKFVEVLGLY